ncbi:unnamed protein product [Hymenolepis diminuta]|uniref:C2H2-type domain-containing protein n=1 Tax=Hymenolepis diminuta TaxID=6216 RepID=A0A158QCZ9_HYMDI|nr:unnamed protein product [Hymenolepis diminuta]
MLISGKEKHISSCEREWIRVNCKEERKSSKESGPYVKAHVTGYEVQVKTFADMLSLGAERRRRWRLRHHEFIRTIKAAKTNCFIDGSDKSDLFYELNSKIVHAGLTQCEYCKRRFNDAAYFKHVVQCKEKQTDAKMQPTEEQKEAKERFMRRMKYNTKLVGKDQSEKTLFYPEEQSINKGDTSGANETYYNQQQYELINKLADKLCSELQLSQTPITEILQTDRLNKIIKNNITLTASEPSQITASLSCCSKSNSAVVLSDNSSSHEKFKSPNPTFNKPSSVQFTRDEHGIGFPQCGGSLDYPCSNLKSSPKIIDNNLINDTDNDNNCKLDHDDVISAICQNKVKPGVKITIEEAEQSRNQHHRLHKNSVRHKISPKSSDANGDSNIVNYDYNRSTSTLSPERINLHQISLKIHPVRSVSLRITHPKSEAEPQTLKEALGNLNQGIAPNVEENSPRMLDSAPHVERFGSQWSPEAKIP